MDKEIFEVPVVSDAVRKQGVPLLACPPKTGPDRMIDLDRFKGGQDGEEEAHG